MVRRRPSRVELNVLQEPGEIRREVRAPTDTSSENSGKRWLQLRPLIVLAVGVILWLSTRRRSSPTQPPAGCRDTPASTALPRPIIVVSAGGQRAGSTVLYNALRILMRMRDPNTISGWHQDLTRILDMYGHRNSTTSAAAALRATGTSVLVKVHHVADWGLFQWGYSADKRGNALGNDADVVFTSHRDVRDIVASVRRMGWGQHIRAADLKRGDFCVSPHPGRRVLVESDYKHADTWVLQAKAIITCRQRLLDAAGSTLVEDFEMGQLVNLDRNKAIELLSRLGRHLDYAYSNLQLSFAATELLALTTPLCQGALDVHPVTHLHRSHLRLESVSKKEQTDFEKQGMRAIEKHEQLAQWLEENGYKRRTDVHSQK